jgi:hypothetical protein
MARAIYPKYKEAILSGGSNTNLVSGDVKLFLVDTGIYTYSAAHEFLSDVTGVVATAIALAGTKSVTNGNFKTTTAAQTFTAVSGNSAEAIIYYVNTGSAATSRLVYYDDQATGLPVTPNGGDITVTVDTTNGIFTI